MKSIRFTSKDGASGTVFTTNSTISGDVKVIPIIPNASQYIRDMNRYGLVGMGVRRVLRLGPVKLLRLGLFGAKRGRKVLKKNFGSLLEVLLFVELLDFKKHKPKFIFLHAQITDLAIANNNKKLLEVFVNLVKKFGAEPGLSTKNLGHLLTKLNQWDSGVNYILSPFNEKGYMMKPSKKVCEDLSKEKILFADFSLPGMCLPNKKDIKYLKSNGVKAIVLPN